jgi:hypothetical protein
LFEEVRRGFVVRNNNPNSLCFAYECNSNSNYLDVSAHREPQGGIIRLGQVVDGADHAEVSGWMLLFNVDFNTIHSFHPFPLNAAVCPAQLPSATALSASTSHTSFDGKKIPKPKNSWIIYRQEKHEQVVSENPGIHNSVICKS